METYRLGEIKKAKDLGYKAKGGYFIWDEMTNTERTKLNEKLARWAGFWFQKLSDLQPRYQHEANLGWVYPTGENNHNLPDFTNSLDACFKWLVPKLYERKLWLHLYCDGIMGTDARIYEICGNRPVSIYQTETPALALCLALEKLIDAGVK